MKTNFLLGAVGALAGMSVLAIGPAIPLAFAQQQQSATAEAAAAGEAPEPLSEDELEVLVARIALYPDELVALIAASSIYPLQIVEATRYLEKVKKSSDLKPKESWDGSVISLLNYPDIVKMMSDDLDWTQAFGEAIANQQRDVLTAIQQLRDKAVADNIIKSDDKITVVEEGDNVVIQSASADTVYIPQYEPAMLYDPGYPPKPITYADSYPSYYYPAAPYFAAAFTGFAFAAAVDWNDWGVWGGNWDGGDLNINCNNCFNNRDFNGKVNWGDVDWKNVDRSKINFDRSQLSNVSRSDIKNRVEANDRNNMKNRVADAKRGNAAGRPGGNTVKDVRKSTLDGLKAQPSGGQRANSAKPGGNGPGAASSGAKRPANTSSGGKRPNQANRTGGKPKPAARPDNRPKKPLALGQVQNGRTAKSNSNRGRESMGGGSRGGGGRGGGGRGR